MAGARSKPAPVVSAGARKVIASVLEDAVTPERVKAVLDAAFESEILVDVVCEDCGGKLRVKRPDVKRQVDTLVALTTEAQGRPEQAQPEATTVIVERPPL